MTPNELRKHIQSLQRTLDHIKTQLEAISEHNKAATQQQDPDRHQSRASIVTLHPSVDTYYSAENNERKSRHRWLVFERLVAFCGLLAIIAYVVVTAYTLGEIKRQANSAQEQLTAGAEHFRLDERPWVGISFTAAAKITVTVGKSFFVPVTLINSGRTPAKNVTGNVAVDLLRNGEAIKFSYTPGRASYKIFAGTIFPTGAIDRSFESIHHGPQRAEATIVTKEIFDSLLANRTLAIVHGRIEYSDPFGTPHWTTFCRNVFNPSVIPIDCMKYNDTDNNK